MKINDIVNLAEGQLNEPAIFLNPNTVIVGQVHGKPLELYPETLKRIQAIAKKHGAWYEGNGMDQKFTKGIIDDYRGSWDDDLLSPSIKGYPYPFLYVLFSNIKANDTVKGKIGSDPKVTIFDRILNTQPSTNYFPDRTFSSEDLTKFLKSVSQGKYDFVKMSKAPATEKNVQRFFKIGEKLMWPENWEEYPNRAGKLAKQVNDLRDKFLASRKSGVYVVGSSHLIAVRNFVNKQGVAQGKVIHTYLWHGSRQKIDLLEPRQAVDTGGAAGSNQNAIYATSDPIFAIQMGMPAAGSDYGHFPNDPQMVLFSGKIRKGEYVYLHKLPFKGPDGKPQFVQGGNNREFHSIPGVEGIKPIEIKEIPVNRYLNLIRKATPADLKLRKKYMKKQGVAEGKMAELDMDLEDPEISDREFEKMYGMTRKEARELFSRTNMWDFPQVRDPNKPLHEQGVAENNLTEFAPGPDFRDDDDRKDMPLLEFAEIIKLFLGSEYTMINHKTPEQVSVKFYPKDRTSGHNGAMLYSVIRKQNEYPTVNFQLIDYEQGPQVGRGRRAGTAIPKTRANALKIADIIYNTMGLPKQDRQVEENFADGKNPGRKGLAKRMGVPTKASVTRLRQIAKSSSGEKQRMAHWMANMKAGKKK